jgi:hypothetical protein
MGETAMEGLRPVGRKTRRVERAPNSLDLHAPVLSPSVRVSSVQNSREASVGDSRALKVMSHPRRGSKPARKS